MRGAGLKLAPRYPRKTSMVEGRMFRRLLKKLGPGSARELARWESYTVYGLAIVSCSVFIAIAFGYYLNEHIVLYWFLGVILATAFLTVNGGPERPQRGSLFGWSAATAAIAVSIYFIFRDRYYETMLPMVDPLTLGDKIAGIILIVLVLEATRRVIGVTLVIVVSFFLAYAVFGQWIQGPFWHRALSLTDMLDELVFTVNGIFGKALHVAAFLVFVFVTFGALLDRCGGGDFFFDLANSLVGRQVGGPAKVAVVSSGLYGSISGSPTSDVVTTGTFTIPMMIRTGLSPLYAGAIEAAASTGGALLPPVMGTAAFLMVDFTGIAYQKIVVAAIVPAILYYSAIFLAIHYRSKLERIKPSADASTPTFLSVLRYNWYFFVPIGLLIWYVIEYDRPAYSASLALASLVPITLWRVRSAPKLIKAIFDAFDDTLRRMTGIGVACAVAGLVIGTLGMTDLTGKVSSAMFALSKDSVILTLMTATVVIVVLGMGMPTPAVYALSAVLAAPALLVLGIKLLPAHLFIVYFSSMSAITPPIAVAAFAASSIAGANPMAIGFLCCRLALVGFLIPFVFIYHPGILLIGSASTIMHDIITSALAVAALVTASEGYCMIPLSVGWRIVFLVSGGLLLATSLIPAACGAMLFLGSITWLWKIKSRAPPYAGLGGYPGPSRPGGPGYGPHRSG